MAYKYKILDWYVHQGNQREFFKTGHNFSLLGVDGNLPTWDINHRPLNSNVRLITDDEANSEIFDYVINISRL